MDKTEYKKDMAAFEDSWLEVRKHLSDADGQLHGAALSCGVFFLTLLEELERIGDEQL